MLEQIKQKRAVSATRRYPCQLLYEAEVWFDIELPYSSIAIEGNTLTREETARVLAEGLVLRGKPLKDQQEAVDHRRALRLGRGLARERRAINEKDVLDIHGRVVETTQPSEAGLYSQHRRRIAGSMVVFPNPAKVPSLMEEFGSWLSATAASAEAALEAHLRLVSTHPFSDGNGRTARLLMNLILMRAGYPPLVVRPEDRSEYLEAIEKYQLEQDATVYTEFMLRRLDASLDDSLRFLEP